MSEKIIYEKKYPCLDWIDETEPFQELEFLDIPHLSAEELYEKLMSEEDLIPLAKRMKDSEIFIRMAITISKLYEFDIKITRSEDQITVEYLVPAGACAHNIRYMFAMADECFFNIDNTGHNLIVELTYYTHASVSFGQIISPDIDEEDLFL